ncbi:Carbamoyl-phosphate synthase small chain [subsurface metagenome]
MGNWGGFLKKKNAVLVLEDGTVIYGTGFGAEKEASGEVVFNTSMSGYVESLTDPSYNSQILMLTYPLIGNYKVHPDWFESDRIWAEGLIVKEVCENPSHWKGAQTLDEFLKEFNIPGIMGVDTRVLTIKIRERGVMKGIIVTYTGENPSAAKLLKKVRKQLSISELDLVSETTCKQVGEFDGGGKLKVVLIDCGVKRSIIRSLLKRGVSVMCVPASTTSKEIESFEPNGIVISNGPGDPAIVSHVRETVRKLLPQYPMMGISLGHQILALASGAKTLKLKFGHRGSNHPVKDLETGKVRITSQNHGFAVDADSLEGTGFQITKVNCNDNTVEGMSHVELPIISVQYYPEWDNQYLFDKFVEMLNEYR